MPRRNMDLFERLRRVGVRKDVAKTLSELGEGAGKKAIRVGHSAVAELRALTEELEKLLPGTRAVPRADKTPGDKTPADKTPGTADRNRRRTIPKPTAAQASKAAGPRPRGKTARPAPARKRQPAAQPTSPAARAPRGENKAKILAALKAGPRTASELGAETGIGTGTVSATLTKMVRAGEVTKAARGYALPK